MSLRAQIPAGQKMQALCVGLFAMRVMDMYMPSLANCFAGKGKGVVDVDTRNEALAKLIPGDQISPYKSYCEAVIFEQVIKDEGNLETVILFMQTADLNRKQCDVIIKFWLTIQRRSLYFCDRLLPKPDLRTLLSSTKEISKD